METLAQSISSVAPTAGPTVLIPLVFASAGNGTWLSYLLATGAVLLVALNVSSFASYSASPGSLYAYASSVSRGAVGQLAAWGLLMAYIGTASAVTGGFANYANVLLKSFLGLTVPPLLLAASATVIATVIAYRDVKISARVMLWFEAISVALILLVIVTTLARVGVHLDPDQFKLRGASSGGIRLGLILAIFSFVGFESATALGEEARDPLRTIPRAVILSALFAGFFFVFCAYAEVLGFKEAHQSLGQATSPLHVLAGRVGLAAFGPVIDIGAALSFFACAMSCITAGARVVLLMSRERLLPKSWATVHLKNRTPAKAVVFVGAASVVGPAILFARGATGFDVNGLMGSLATYGFIVAYLLVCVAMPIHLRREGHLTAKAMLISGAAVLAMMAALIGSLYPLPPTEYLFLAGLFAVYLLGGFVWSLQVGRRSNRV